jgi:deoxyribonuclease IV
MPFLGAHMSIAGGRHLAFERIRAVRGQAMQIFTANQRQWRLPAVTPEGVAAFQDAWRKSGRMPVAAHDSYLINLAAVDRIIERKSVEAFAEEIRRAAALGISFLVAHPGAHMGLGVEEGLRRFARNLDRAFSLAKEQDVRILIETTAAQGSSLGGTFEEIAFILHESGLGDCLGVCFDTCHVFAAGYDLRTPEAYEQTMDRFQRVVGLDRIRFFHINDSKRELGAHVDRHEHIGKGQIGREAFRLLLNDPRFASHPMVLETPKGKEMREDRINLRLLRSLLASRSDRKAIS